MNSSLGKLFSTSQFVRRFSQSRIRFSAAKFEKDSFLVKSVSQTKELPYIWLRDFCKCDKCYNSQTNQIEIELNQLNLNTKPVKIEDGGEFVDIQWDDGHFSKYKLSEIVNYAFDEDAKSSVNPVYWNKKRMTDVFSEIKFEHDAFLKDKSTQKKAFKALLMHGALVVDKVPKNSSLKNICERISPVQSTIFGKDESVVTAGNMDHADTAYSMKPLKAHNDNTYLKNAGGLMAFHVVESSGAGGASLLVDGFNCANELRRKFPKEFQFLSEKVIKAEYRDKNHHFMRYADSVIKLDHKKAEFTQIRYNIYDRVLVNHLSLSETLEYYESMKKFGGEIENPANEFWFRLETDQVLIFNNFRLLHGRSAISGKRTLKTAYMQYDEFLSNAHISINNL